MAERALLQHSALLEPIPASAAVARRLVRDALVAVGETDVQHAAVLAVSELVTNAILHAATDIEITVEITTTDVKVSVRDWHSRLPTRRTWDATATTGRGLRLVASFTDEFGVDLHPPHGKSVWFRLLRGPRTESPSAEWDVEDLLVELSSTPAKEVVLTRVPGRLWSAGREQWEAVLRELYLYAQSQPADDALDLVAAGRALASLSAAVDRSSAAADPSSSELDARLLVAEDELVGFGALQDALDTGLRLGADARLLIRPALPEIVALRDWACEQVLAQVNGVPASPWAGADDPRFVQSRSDVVGPAWDASQVSASDRPAIAADDNNRIIAVSAPAAELLGWAVGDLTGRRIVTIVPPRLREAHIAGFTRHLTTGETHVLGVPLELPVLRADGTELLCGFLIERAVAEVGRAVYVAWLEPLPA